MFVSCFMVKAPGWSWSWLVLVEQAARRGWRGRSRLGRLEVGHALRIGRRERRGALGGGRVDPDSIDLLLGLLGDVADHLDLALPAAREQSAGFAEVEAGDVGLLVIRPGRNAQEFGGGVVAGKGAHPRGGLAR